MMQEVEHLSQTPRGEPHYRLHTAKGISVNLKDQDKSSDNEQQPPLGDTQPQNRWGGGLHNQREHHMILTKYEAVHPTVVSENNSSSSSFWWTWFKT